MPRIKAGALTAAAKRAIADKAEIDQAGDYPVPIPSEVLTGEQTGWSVAVDTETSGLYVDDGARVAVVSVGWIPPEITDDYEALSHTIATGEGVVSYAFPFDQGVRDKVLPPWAAKRYHGGQLDLFAQDDINLPRCEWDHLLAWLQTVQHDYHNAKFDLHHLRAGTRFWPGFDFLPDIENTFTWVGHDSLLTAKELWPTEKTALKGTGGIAPRLWGEDESLEQQALKRWTGPQDDPRYDLVPWSVIGPYATKDTNQTTRLSWYQRLLIEEGQARPVWVRENLEYMACLYLMEKRGMGYDSVRSLEVADRLEELKGKIAARLPFEPGVNSAKRYYFGPRETGNLGLRPIATTKTGQPQLDEDVMRIMVRERVPHIADYAEWRKLDTANSMWFRGYAEKVGPDGRIRTTFRQTDVRSGRVSVERFQAQALPHAGKLKLLPPGAPGPRDLVTFCDEGWEVDLAQAELRVAAVKAKCSSMIEQIVAGEDLHGNVTTELFGVTKGDSEWFTYRQVGKRADFSLIFGVGWKTFQATLRKEIGLEMDEAQCRDVITKWNNLFPEYRRVIHQYDQFVQKNKYVDLANGKRRYFADYELQFGAHAAFNQYVQPSLAELQKDLTIDTEKRHPGVLVMTVHDSQYLECPAGQGEAIARDVAARAEELGTRMFKIQMPADVSRWGEH